MVELGGIERGGHPSPTWSAVRRISFNKKAEVFAEIKNGGARRDRTGRPPVAYLVGGSQDQLQ